MTFPTVTVEFSPGTGPFDTAVWVDITDRVLSLSWSIGVEQDLQDYPPGEATIVLQNDDRLFDPDHATGTYFGQLLPRVPFRIRATAEDPVTVDGEYVYVDGDPVTLGSTTHDCFYGFVEDGWEQEYRPPEGSTCVVRLVDLLAVLEGYTLPGVMDKAIMDLDPVGYWPMDDKPGAQGITDLTGTNEGTIVDEPILGEPSIAPALGTSIEFDGVNDRVDITRGFLVPDITHLTVIGVFNTEVPADVSSASPIFIEADGSDSFATTMFIVFVHTDGHLRLSYHRPGDGSFFTYESPDAVDDGLPHVFFAQSNLGEASDFGLAVDTATLEETFIGTIAQSGNGTALGGTPFAADGYDDNYFNGRLSNIAAYDVSLTSTQRQGILDAYAALDGLRSDQQVDWILDTIGVPATMVDLDVGASICGPLDSKGKNALELIRAVTNTEQGAFYVDHQDGGKLKFRYRYHSWLETRATVAQAAFSDDPDADLNRIEPGSLKLESNGVRSVINQATVGWAGGEVVVDEATSQSAYGPRGRTVNTSSSTPAIARGIGQWIVANNAQPKTRVRGFGVNSGADPTGFTPALNLKIGDRCTLRRHPQAEGSAVTHELEVLGATHRVEGLSWNTDWYVRDAPNVGQDLFLLGSSLLGGTHILAY